MTNETIGNAIFSEHTRGKACGILPGRHAPATVERVRTDNFGVEYFCKPHAAQAKRDAKAKEVRLARAQRDLADRIRRAKREARQAAR